MIADQIIREQGKNIALFCMEELDESLARDIREKMDHEGRCQIISSREFNASQMTAMLCQVDLLVTSRYHATVLSLRSGVPQIAVGHDPRLDSLYQDLGLYEDYYLSHCASNLWKDLVEKIRLLLADPDLQKAHLERGYQEQLSLSHKNPLLLHEFLIKKMGVKL